MYACYKINIITKLKASNKAVTLFVLLHVGNYVDQSWWM